MAIEYNFTLDMDRSKRDNNIAYARTGDVDSITINADLVFNGAAYTPTGTNAFFECITPNGHSVRVAAEKTGSSVSVEVPSAAFQAAGVINVAYFRFETGEASNPTYVESTEPFAIVVRGGIGDDIDAGDYIEEWRQLADQLEAIVAEVEQKAEQAEAAITEQKKEVDQLKAQAQVSIAQDAEDVSDAKDAAISNINGSQGAVDAAIDKLEQKTQEAVDAAQEALDGTLATDLQNAIDRTLKLDVDDMTVIADNTSLSSLVNVGSYCCKTAATAATIGDSPVDDSPFNMYVFSSSTSGQVMQLVVPIDLNSKPTAEWHVRFGTSSAMDPWSVIGGGADIAAGLGIDVTGDAKKTVALDTDSFYQHHEATDIIQGSTEVTGGGRIKELTVFGNTRQNLWMNPSGTVNGVTVTANEDGSITLSGTSTSNNTWIYTPVPIYSLRPGSTYTLSVMGGKNLPDNADFRVESREAGGSGSQQLAYVTNSTASATFTVPDTAAYFRFIFRIGNTETALSGTYRIMLNEGSEPEPWCTPGINGVDELSVVCAGKNLLAPLSESAPLDSMLAVDVDSQTFSVHGENTGAAKLLAFFTGSTALESAARTGRLRVVTNISQFDKIYFQINAANIDGSGDATVVRVGNSSFVDVFTISPTKKITSIFLGIAKASTVNRDGLWVAVVRDGDEVDGHPLYAEPSVTEIDLDGHTLNGLPDGTRDELRVDGTGAVTLVQRVGVATAPTAASGWTWSTDATGGRASFGLTSEGLTPKPDETSFLLCDKLPVRKTNGDASYAIVSNWLAYAKNPAITSTATAATVAGGATYLYPLATPQEVELPVVSMPSLASPSYTIFASSNVPAEIEAEVVKVDYLPPSDVYTKEEVDKKIEDAGMPDVVPVSQGGTGVTTAAAERNRLGLGNTTGALPVANGGTGAADAKAAQYNLLNSAPTEDNAAGDSSLFMFASATPSSTYGVLFKRTGLSVWYWIVSKIRSTFGFNSSNVLPVANGGTGSTSAKAAQNSLLNDMNVSSDALTDGSMLVGYNISPSASNGAVHKRSVLTVWNYIVGKIRSTFGFTSSNVLTTSNGGTGASNAASARTNLGVYSKSEVDGKVPKVVYGTGNIPGDAANGTIYIQYRS